MPSPHRRIGLVVDDPVDSALRLFRVSAEPSAPEARLVRSAVLEGAMIEAAVQMARGTSSRRGDAVEVLRRFAELLPELPLDAAVKAELIAGLERVKDEPSRDERRSRQLAYLKQAKPRQRQTAQDIADTFDAFESVPVR